MDLDIVLGIDPSDPVQVLANDLVQADKGLLADLIAVRARRGLTQTDVSERMGISQSAVARIESGERDLHMSTVRRYAHAVRASISHGVEPFVSDRQRLLDDLAVDPYMWESRADLATEVALHKP